MSCKIGVDKRYKPQPAPCRYEKTYRCERRNEMKATWFKTTAWSKKDKIKVCDRKIWGHAFYSDRHFVHSSRPSIQF